MPIDSQPAAPAAAEAPASAEAAPEAPAAEGTTTADFRARAVAVLAAANAEAGQQASGSEKPAAAEGKPGAPAPPPATDDPGKEGKAPEDPWSTKFAQLNDGQRKLRAEQEAWKQSHREEREALRREQIELDAVRQAKASGSPVKALIAMGWSYEDATNEVLGKPVAGKREAKPEEAKIDPKLDALTQEVAQLKQQAFEERERAAVATYAAELKALAAQHADTYELTAKSPRALARALEWTKDYVREHGALPGENQEKAMHEALAYVEKEREAELFDDAVLTSKKLASRLKPVSEAPKPAARPQATSAKSPSTSLSNSLAAAPPRTVRPEPQTPEEYRRAAAAVLAEDAG